MTVVPLSEVLRSCDIDDSLYLICKGRVNFYFLLHRFRPFSELCKYPTASENKYSTVFDFIHLLISPFVSLFYTICSVLFILLWALGFGWIYEGKIKVISKFTLVQCGKL